MLVVTVYLPMGREAQFASSGHPLAVPVFKRQGTAGHSRKKGFALMQLPFGATLLYLQ